MKKRIIALLLAAVMLLGYVPVPATATEHTHPTFVVDTVTASAGETVDVTIRLENNPGITSIKLSLEYADGLTLESVTGNPDLGGMFMISPEEQYPVFLNWANALSDIAGDWVYVTLRFAVDSSAAAGKYPVTITYDPDDVYNVDEENVAFEIDNGAVVVDSHYGRQQLAGMSNAKALLYAYDQIAAGVEASAESIGVYNGADPLSVAELQMVMDVYGRDYAHHFWLDNGYSYSSDSSGVVSLMPRYILSGSELESAKAAFEQKVAGILAGLTDSMSEYERELYIHDRLAEIITYANGDNAHNAYGALVEGKAVCEGYAEALQYLLQRAGIQSFIALGSSINPATNAYEGHAWNYVRIDGEYYHVDLTWDDQGENLFHTYFNQTDAVIRENHMVSEVSYTLPTCDSVDAQYFTGKDTYLDDYTAAEVGRLLKDNGLTVHVYLPGDVDGFISWYYANIVDIATEAGVSGGFSYGYTRLGRGLILAISTAACDHSRLTFQAGADASCAADGYKAYYKCSCGKYFEDSAASVEITNLAAWKAGAGKIPASHNLTEVAATAATCDKDGNIAYFICECGEWFLDAEATQRIADKNSVVIKALSHSFTDYVSDANATCDQDGTETAKCDHCEETDTRVDSGSREDAAHTFPVEYTSDGNAGCTTDGTKSRVCTTCGEKETVTDEGSALGHNYQSGVCTMCGVSIWDLNGNGVLDILTIGNSHTANYTEFIPKVLTDLYADGLETKISLTKATIGSIGLYSGRNSNANATYRSHLEAMNNGASAYSYLSKKQYDLVIVQDYMESLVDDPAVFADGLASVIEKINEIATENGYTEPQVAWFADWVDIRSSGGDTALRDGEGNKISLPKLTREQTYQKSLASIAEVESRIAAGCDNMPIFVIQASTIKQNAMSSYLGSTKLWENQKYCLLESDTTHMTNELGKYLMAAGAMSEIIGYYADSLALGQSGTNIGAALTLQNGPDVAGTGSQYEGAVNAEILEIIRESIALPIVFKQSAYVADPIDGYVSAFQNIDWNYDDFTDQESALVSIRRQIDEAIGSEIDAYTVEITEFTSVEQMTIKVRLLHGYSLKEIEKVLHRCVYSTTVTAPTCTEAGYTTHTCKCGDSYVDTYVPATGHSLGAWTEVKSPTCTEKGSERRDCANCDHFETRDVAATGHKYVAVVTAPTITERGYTTYTCHCGDSYVGDYVDELGHYHATDEMLNDGESLVLAGLNVVKHNHTMIFSADVQNLGQGLIRLSHGQNSYGGSYVEITADQLIVYTVNNSVSSKTYTHGLNIEGNVHVRIETGVSNAVITITTATGEYVRSIGQFGCNGEIACSVENAALTDVDLRWYATGIESDYWFFGDSWFSTTSNAKWTKYLMDDGYTDVLLCGYPGMGASAGLKQFEELLNFEVPQYAIWTMGMNNGDRNGEINASWLSATEEFLALCDEYGITPILCTIPTTPKVNNRLKNAWIEASGYRYIDFDLTLVENHETGEWFEGTAASDLNHPNAKGAEMLYPQVFADFPELAKEDPATCIHKLHLLDERQADCENGGRHAYYVCSLCASTFKDEAGTMKTTTAENLVLPMGHAMGEWVTTEEATCTEDGTSRRDCDRCDYFEEKSVETVGHKYTEVVTAPACTAQGYTTHTCHCGDSYIDSYVSATGHSFGKWTEVKTPTCTEKGSERRDCANCDHFETRVVAATGHRHVAVVTAPTCTTQGYTTHTCRCGDSYIDSYVSATGHSFGEWTEVKTPTCTEKGSERRDCANCDHFETRDVAATGHKYTEVVTAPTCTEQGYTTHTCHCGDEYVDTRVAALGHVWDAGVVTKEPTETETGLRLHNCDRCDETKTVTIPTLDHVHDHKAVVTAPTCTEQGYTTHTCRCGDSYVDTYVSATGHSMGDWAEVKAPTCAEKGSERRDCANCDHFETRDVAATGHKHEEVVTAPTCTELGYTTYTCHCGDSYVDNYVPALKHDWNEGEVTVPPTEETAGEMLYTCQNCGETYTDVIQPTDHVHQYKTEVVAPTCTESGYTAYTCELCGFRVVENYVKELGHSEVIQEAVAPTCTEDGWTEGSYCEACGEVFAEQTVIGALGHELTDWQIVKKATCTEKGQRRLDCNRCDYFETEEIPATGHNYKSVVTKPTCVAQGYTTYTCHCGNSFVDNYTPATGHKMGQWTMVTKPAPGRAGQERRDCDRCDHFETRSVAYQGNALVLTGEDLTKQKEVWIEGMPYPVITAGDIKYVELPTEKDCILVTYTYQNANNPDIHTQYPTGMKVYKVSGGKITHIKELDNLLQYSGSSIRITGKKGIRMITSITKANKTALTGKGLAGYKLVEYGTALCWASEIKEGDALVLGKSFTRSNYAYKKGVADPIFASTKDLVQYTNVLVGFTNDQCKDDIAMRPYIILEDAKGEKITLYGGTIYRSIGYIAYQNRNVVKKGTEAYKYVWDIIHHVYGTKYDADYKG